jgi:hypothetical protein
MQVLDRAEPGLVELSYTQTVDRHSVHRWSVSEVFLTDVQPISGGRFAAAAQLPTSHSYYGDHVLPGELIAGGDVADRGSSAVDPMLLMECFRQSATWLAHHSLEVPMGTAFLVTEWSLRLTRVAQIDRTGRPGCVRIDLEAPQALSRGGLVRSARYLGELVLDGTPIGHADVAARYVPAAEAAAVRAYHRTTSPPLSTSLPARPAGRPVEPLLVGRRDAENVVLFDAEHRAEATVARLGTRPDHRGFFDHPQDHYTAMILFEAARQIALLDHHSRRPRAETWLTGLAGRFHYFAELDAPVQLRAMPTSTGTAVQVQQHDRAVAELRVLLGSGVGHD